MFYLIEIIHFSTGFIYISIWRCVYSDAGGGLACDQTACVHFSFWLHCGAGFGVKAEAPKSV